jgi:hypothetical protein
MRILANGTRQIMVKGAEQGRWQRSFLLGLCDGLRKQGHALVGCLAACAEQIELVGDVCHPLWYVQDKGAEYIDDYVVYGLTPLYTRACSAGQVKIYGKQPGLQVCL